jgi:hypothetical protein
MFINLIILESVLFQQFTQLWKAIYMQILLVIQRCYCHYLVVFSLTPPAYLDHIGVLPKWVMKFDLEVCLSFSLCYVYFETHFLWPVFIFPLTSCDCALWW